jgi:putative transposase
MIFMPQSLCKICTHIVFSTKHHQPFIDKSIETELFKFLAGICKNLECLPINVGGYIDHVHILCLLSKKITVIKLLEEIKKSSSKWMKTKGDRYKNFYWQDGYGAFSVNNDDIHIVSKYILNQEQHHKSKSFKNEFRELLDRYGIEYDEKYVWD